MRTCEIIFEVFIVLFSFFFCFPASSFAASTPRCTDTNPGSTPVITDATTTTESVTLVWSESLDPVTHYTLAYGPSKLQLIYGVPDMGPKGTTTYTINQLTTGQRYYFRIRAVNNCEPGDFSDTVSAIPGIVKGKEMEYEQPPLSFFKPVLGASIAAKKKVNTIFKINSTKFLGCSTITCEGLPLLLLESMLLIAFFFLSQRVGILMPIFSVLIPIGTYLFFWSMTKGCVSNQFFCKYFFSLNIFIFVIISIFHRQHFFHKSTEQAFMSEKRQKT